MTLRRSSVQPLCRAAVAVLLTGGVAVLGAPAAAAAEDDTPVVSLDPPDAELFLIATENYANLFGGPGAASTDGADDASAAFAAAAALAPPEIAETLGAESVTVASHNGNGEIDVEYGGTVTVRLPALVDASASEVRLELYDPADPEAEPRVYSTDPAAVDPLTVVDLGGNEFEVTLPADDATFGPEAYLTFDDLTGTDAAISNVYPLDYYLEFTGTGVSAVTLEPSVGLFTAASCSVSDYSCPSTDVQAGRSFDFDVPPSSLLRTLGLAQMETAEVFLVSEESDAYEEYYSDSDDELMTRHDAYSATFNLPADMAGGLYFGAVIQGDPFSGSGYVMTGFEVDVEAINAGLRSDTGWVEDVREGAAGSTKAVAGTAMLVVAGLITVVAVAPRRRPPAEG